MKSRTAVIALAVAVVLIAAIVFFGRVSGASEAYESFSLAMDHLAGQGKWSAASHDIEPFESTLVVKDLSFPWPPRSPQDSGQRLTIKTLKIRDGLSKAELKKVLAQSSWQNQKEVQLAEGLIIEDLSGVAGDKPMITVKEIKMEKPSLAEAGADNPEGALGFVKALRFKDLSWKDLAITRYSGEVIGDIKSRVGRLEDLSWAGELNPELLKINPSGRLALAAALHSRSALVEDIFVGMKSGEKGPFSALSLKKLKGENLAGWERLGFLELADGFLEMDLADGTPPLALGHESLQIKGLGLKELLDKCLPLALEAAKSPQRAAELYLNFLTLGSLFTPTLTIEEFKLKGFGGQMGPLWLKLSKAEFLGYEAGKLSPRQFCLLEGLELSLPTEAQSVQGSECLTAFYEFGRDFGQTHFKLDSSAETNYEADSGRWKRRLHTFELKDLGSFSGYLDLGGLTAERLAALNKIAVANSYLALLMPEQILGQLSLNEFDLRFLDEGLTEKIMGYIAKTEFNSDDGNIVRQALLNDIKLQSQQKGNMYLVNPDDLAKPLTEFFSNPGTMELLIRPEPALSLQSIEQTAPDGNINRLLDSLNISLSANGLTYDQLRFKLPFFSPAMGLEIPEN